MDVTKMRRFCFAAILLVACGETAVDYSEPDMQSPRPFPDYRMPNRDFNPVRDAGVRSDADLGTATTRNESRSSFFPGEYVAYGLCPETITYGGQMTVENPMAPNGGRVRTRPYPSAYDSGLDAILQQIPAAMDGDDPPSVMVNLRVENATVVATRSDHLSPSGIRESQGRFWVADGRGTIEVYIDLNAQSVPPFAIQVGTVLSFSVSEIGRYGDRAQIRRATDFQEVITTPHSGLSAGPNAEVALYEPNGELTIDRINQMIRISGLLDGEPERCGSGHFCWSLAYPGGTTIFRTRDDDLRPGTCITYVGPVSSYRGRVQLEPFNPIWARRYQKGLDLGEACDTDDQCTTGMCIRLDNTGVCGLGCETNEDCPARTVCSSNVCLPQAGSECPDEVVFEGQLQGAEAMVPNGGSPRFEPFPDDYDSGLEGLVSRLPPVMPDGDGDARFVDIPIERATIIATRAFTDTDVPESQGRFWIADGRAAVEVYLDLGMAGGTPNFPVRVGQVVSFTATRVGRYQTKPQISAATDWIQHADEPPFAGGETGPNAAVHLWDPDREMTRLDANRLIRVTGQLDGPGNTCGSGHRCWNLDYGFDQPLILRTSNQRAETGSCVTFVGPLGVFRGNLQLDTTNLDWITVYE